MHRRFVDFEGFDVERNQCESDIRSIRLRSSRRIGLRQENPLDRPRQIFVHHLFGLSTSLEKEDNDSLLSTLSSIQFLTENSDNDEIVTVFLQENVIDKLLGIVSLHEDGAVLNAVYSLLARLTCVSAAVVSKIMVPDFLSTSLSLLSSADDGLTLIVLNVLYNSAVAGDDYCAFEVENDVTAHLLRYLLTCQPSTVVRNEKSCCGRLELEESRQQTIATCLLLLTELIKVSFPEALKEEVVTGCVPYFLSGNRHVQLLALKYARHFVSNSENEYFLQFSLPNNQMNASDPTRITVLSYLVDLLREKQIDYEQNARVFHVFRRVCADINDQLMDPERTTRAEPSCLRTVESDMMSVFQNCLKTIGTILAIFGELAYFSEEHEQIVIDSGIYPSLGKLLNWSIIVTSEGIPAPLMSTECDYEYFRAAVETNSELEEPFALLEPLKTAFRRHNLLPPLAYRDSIGKFIFDGPFDHTLSIHPILELNGAKDSLVKNVLFIVGNALGGTAAHVEIVLSSLLQNYSAIEATRKVIVTLQTFFYRLPLKLLTLEVRCIYLLAGLPLEHQSVLVESELLQLAWNRRRDLDGEAGNYLVHSFVRLLQPSDESSPTVANALLERIENETFAVELDEMCSQKSPTIRKCYRRLRTFLETLRKTNLFADSSTSDYRSSA